MLFVLLNTGKVICSLEKLKIMKKSSLDPGDWRTNMLLQNPTHVYSGCYKLFLDRSYK